MSVVAKDKIRESCDLYPSIKELHHFLSKGLVVVCCLTPLCDIINIISVFVRFLRVRVVTISCDRSLKTGFFIQFFFDSHLQSLFFLVRHLVSGLIIVEEKQTGTTILMKRPKDQIQCPDWGSETDKI